MLGKKPLRWNEKKKQTGFKKYIFLIKTLTRDRQNVFFAHNGNDI